MRMSRLLIIMTVLLPLSAAHGQKLELGVVGGAVFHPNADTAGAVEGSVAYRLKNFHVASLYAELPIAGGMETNVHVLPVLTCTNPCTLVAKYSPLFVTPGVKLKLLPASPVSPFVSFGVGVAHFDQTRVSANTTTQNSAAIQAGGGLDWKIFPHLSVRGEVRNYNSGSATGGTIRENHLLVGGGIVVRF